MLWKRRKPKLSPEDKADLEKLWTDTFSVVRLVHNDPQIYLNGSGQPMPCLLCSQPSTVKSDGRLCRLHEMS